MRNALHKTLEAFAAIWFRTDRQRSLYYLDQDAIGEPELGGKVIRVKIEVEDEKGPLAAFLEKEEGKVFADYLEKSGSTIT